MTRNSTRSLQRLAAVGTVVLLPAIAYGADPVDAVTTPASGTLTMCRDWFNRDACDTYHRIKLPARIAVGDRVEVTYGSNPKDYIFHVTVIRRDGERCTIFSTHSAADGSGERLEISECRPAPAR